MALISIISSCGDLWVRAGAETYIEENVSTSLPLGNTVIRLGFTHVCQKGCAAHLAGGLKAAYSGGFLTPTSPAKRSATVQRV